MYAVIYRYSEAPINHTLSEPDKVLFRGYYSTEGIQFRGI